MQCGSWRRPSWPSFLHGLCREVDHLLPSSTQLHSRAGLPVLRHAHALRCHGMFVLPGTQRHHRRGRCSADILVDGAVNMRRGADEVFYVPVEELLGESLKPNAKRKRRTKKQVVDEALNLYDGYANFLVRTAVIRATEFDQDEAPVVSTPEDAYALCKHLAYADQEHLVVLALDNSSRLRAIHESAIGGSSSVSAQLQHIVKVPLLVSATVVIVVHNHPSGKAEPSIDDHRLTGKLKGGIECLNLQLADHIIVTRQGFYSFAMSGAL